jgi:hypothetical protein
MLSNEVRLNKIIGQLTEARAYDQWRDWRVAQHKQVGKPPSIQECLSEAEAILQRATRKVTKHNGAGDNQTFTESTWPEYSESVGSINESADVGDPRVALIESYKLTCPELSEADIRQVLGLPPKGLTRKQAAQFNLCVSCGISRAEAEKLAKQN